MKKSKKEIKKENLEKDLEMMSKKQKNIDRVKRIKETGDWRIPENEIKEDSKMEKKEKKFEGFVKPLSKIIDNQEKKLEQRFGLAKAMFEYSEKELEDFVDSMVNRAERLVDDLKRERGYFNDKKDEADTAKQGLMSRADCFRSILGTVQNCFNNFSFQDAARYVANYEKSKAIFNVLSGKDRW